MPPQTLQDEIVYRYTPQFDGAFLRNVPKRDLTQKDVDRMTAEQRRDAFSPHPLHGTPLYTAVGKGDGGEPPRWFQDKQDKATRDGVILPPMEPNETQKAYEARVLLIEMQHVADDAEQAHQRLADAINSSDEQDGDA